jgi:hypothetical protein
MPIFSMDLLVRMDILHLTFSIGVKAASRDRIRGVTDTKRGHGDVVSYIMKGAGESGKAILFGLSQGFIKKKEKGIS